MKKGFEQRRFPVGWEWEAKAGEGSLEQIARQLFTDKTSQESFAFRGWRDERINQQDAERIVNRSNLSEGHKLSVLAGIGLLFMVAGAFSIPVGAITYYLGTAAGVFLAKGGAAAFVGGVLIELAEAFRSRAVSRRN